jgi:hypothetical protein
MKGWYAVARQVDVDAGRGMMIYLGDDTEAKARALVANTDFPTLASESPYVVVPVMLDPATIGVLEAARKVVNAAGSCTIDGLAAVPVAYLDELSLALLGFPEGAEGLGGAA